MLRHCDDCIYNRRIQQNQYQSLFKGEFCNDFNCNRNVLTCFLIFDVSYDEYLISLLFIDGVRSPRIRFKRQRFHYLYSCCIIHLNESVSHCIILFCIKCWKQFAHAGNVCIMLEFMCTCHACNMNTHIGEWSC